MIHLLLALILFQKPLETTSNIHLRPEERIQKEAQLLLLALIQSYTNQFLMDENLQIKREILILVQNLAI